MHVEVEKIHNPRHKMLVPSNQKFVAEFGSRHANEISCKSSDEPRASVACEARTVGIGNIIKLGNISKLNIDPSTIYHVTTSGSNIVFNMREYTCQIRENEWGRELYCRDNGFWSDAEKLMGQ